MKNNTRKIVVLDNIDSSNIEQAIFILRDSPLPCSTDAVAEAQRIVKLYLNEVDAPLVRGEVTPRGTLLCVAAAVLALAAVALAVLF